MAQHHHQKHLKVASGPFLVQVAAADEGPACQLPRLHPAIWAQSGGQVSAAEVVVALAVPGQPRSLPPLPNAGGTGARPPPLAAGGSAKKRWPRNHTLSANGHCFFHANGASRPASVRVGAHGRQKTRGVLVSPQGPSHEYAGCICHHLQKF